MLVSVSLPQLFHGLSHGIVDKIIESGFDEVRVTLDSPTSSSFRTAELLPFSPRAASVKPCRHVWLYVAELASALIHDKPTRTD